MYRVFSVAAEHPPRDGLTISTPLIKGREASVTAFSPGSGTDISPETYDNPILYIGLSGREGFLAGGDRREMHVGEAELSALPSGTLCGVGKSMFKHEKGGKQ